MINNATRQAIAEMFILSNVYNMPKVRNAILTVMRKYT
jgi:hypothetical protein